MPGLVGMSLNASDQREARRAQRSVMAMRDLIMHEPSYACDEIADEAGVCASRAHVNVYQRSPQPRRIGDCRVWMDGVINNRDEVAAARRWQAADDPHLIGLIASGENWSALRDIDGFYAAVVADDSRQLVHLISDRFGMRHLYWAIIGGRLVWASELKAMLAAPSFSPRIDRHAVEQFMTIGYVLNDCTWFEGVKLLDPATVLTWDGREGRIESSARYWWWDEIQPRRSAPDRRALAAELHEIFEQAVHRAAGHDARHGVFLSGGLDSRAILAAMPPSCEPIPLVTFGRRDCDDVRVATEAARVRPSRHLVAELTARDWLLPRFAGVWWTDGELPLSHMHGIEARRSIATHLDVNLSGFAGDVILGGSRLPRGADRRHKTKRAYVARAMGCDACMLEGFDAFEGLNSTDFYFLHNRMRRLIYGGTKQSLTLIERQKPFYANAVIEFAYSLPDEARREGSLYRSMLLQAYPEFFARIPYAMEGLPISVPHTLTRARAKLLRMMTKCGVVPPFGHATVRPYADYATWMRQEPARAIIDALLTSDDAMLGEFVDRTEALGTWTQHLWGADRTSAVMRLVTLELWLQQVFAGRYRSSEDVAPILMRSAA